MTDLHEFILRSDPVRVPTLKEIWHLAKIDGDETYRYSLEVIWDPRIPPMGFLGLNPSTASLEEPDHTCKKFYLYARRENAGGFIVGNLGAMRALKPVTLRSAVDPIGPRNMEAIHDVAKRSRPLILCWGCDRFAEELDRGEKLRRLLATHGFEPMCLGTTSAGFPNHPLYLPGDQAIVPYRGRA